MTRTNCPDLMFKGGKQIMRFLCEERRELCHAAGLHYDRGESNPH
jgi:hypothetical protein